MFLQGRLENGACIRITLAAGFIELGDISATILKSSHPQNIKPEYFKK